MESGKHPAGCFYGGPEGQAYWFAVETCELDHAGQQEPLVAPAANVAAAYEHIVAAGLLRTGESG